MSNAPKTIWAGTEAGAKTGVDWGVDKTFVGDAEYTLTSSVSEQLKAADELAEHVESLLYGLVYLGVTGGAEGAPNSLDMSRDALEAYRKAKETT